jgi:peptidyl-prolyl cis-trans isomerase SurA
MMFPERRAALAVLFCITIFTANAQRQEQSEPLFSINHKPVTTEEFVYLYRKNHQHNPEEFTKEKIEEYLNLFINYKLKVEEALSRGMDTTATFRKEFQTYRDELLKPYMPDSKVIDSMVLLTFNRLKEEVNAAHILIRLSPDASPDDTLAAYQKISEIRKRAVAGEDFGSLAAQYSDEPGADVSKGNLGFFTAMQMVFPFEQAAYMTSPGQISEPVRTQFGYHIVKVLDRQPSRGEVEVSHIMIRTSEPNDQDARNTIFDIYEKLQKGFSWEELCAQYSEDPNSKDKGGRLRPFGVGAMASVPEFQNMAFALKKPGDISDPVQSQFGWHILRLESKIPMPSLEEMRPSLTQRVSRDERVKISREALRERMRGEFNYQENSSVKEELLSRADDIVRENEGAAQSIESQVLFAMQNHDYTVKDFLAFVATQSKKQPAAPPRQQLDELFTEFVDKVQIGLLEEKVKRQSPDYRWLLKEYYEGILLFDIMEKEVWNKATEDTIGQKQYFRQHASKYNADERIAGKIYNSSRKTDIEKLKEMVTAAEDIHDFVALNRIRLDSGAFEKEDRAIFSKVSWSPGTYMVDQNGISYLVVVDKILPPGPQTFEEARASVISDYQTYLEDSWISELKRKFALKVEKRSKKRAFAQLIDKR